MLAVFLAFAVVGVLAEPPVFTYIPVVNIVSPALYDSGDICGETKTNNETFTWELYDSTTDTYEAKASGPCVEVPGELGITTEEDLGSDGVIVFRLCVSNDDGTTCSPNSRYEVKAADN